MSSAVMLFKWIGCKWECVGISFIFTKKLNVLRVMMDLSTRWEHTVNGTPVHHTAPYTLIHTEEKWWVANQPTDIHRLCDVTHVEPMWEHIKLNTDSNPSSGLKSWSFELPGSVINLYIFYLHMYRSDSCKFI